MSKEILFCEPDKFSDFKHILNNNDKINNKQYILSSKQTNNISLIYVIKILFPK